MDEGRDGGRDVSLDGAEWREDRDAATDRWLDPLKLLKGGGGSRACVRGLGAPLTSSVGGYLE